MSLLSSIVIPHMCTSMLYKLGRYSKFNNNPHLYPLWKVEQSNPLETESGGDLKDKELITIKKTAVNSTRKISSSKKK